MQTPFLKGLLEDVACEGSTLEQSVPESLCRGSTQKQFPKSSWEGLMSEKFIKDCIPCEGPYAGAEREEEGVAETKQYELNTCPVLLSSCTTQRWRTRNS